MENVKVIKWLLETLEESHEPSTYPFSKEFYHISHATRIPKLKLQLQKDYEKFYEWLEDGTILCEFIIALDPSVQLPKRMKSSAISSTFQRRENLQFFIKWCKENLNEKDMFTMKEFVEEKNMILLMKCLSAIYKKYHPNEKIRRSESASPNKEEMTSKVSLLAKKFGGRGSMKEEESVIEKDEEEREEETREENEKQEEKEERVETPIEEETVESPIEEEKREEGVESPIEESNQLEEEEEREENQSPGTPILSPKRAPKDSTPRSKGVLLSIVKNTSLLKGGEETKSHHPLKNRLNTLSNRLFTSSSEGNEKSSTPSTTTETTNKSILSNMLRWNTVGWHTSSPFIKPSTTTENEVNYLSFTSEGESERETLDKERISELSDRMYIKEPNEEYRDSLAEGVEETTKEEKPENAALKMFIKRFEDYLPPQETVKSPRERLPSFQSDGSIPDEEDRTEEEIKAEEAHPSDSKLQAFLSQFPPSKVPARSSIASSETEEGVQSSKLLNFLKTPVEQQIEEEEERESERSSEEGAEVRRSEAEMEINNSFSTLSVSSVNDGQEKEVGEIVTEKTENGEQEIKVEVHEEQSYDRASFEQWATLECSPHSGSNPQLPFIFKSTAEKESQSKEEETVRQVEKGEKKDKETQTTEAEEESHKYRLLEERISLLEKENAILQTQQSQLQTEFTVLTKANAQYQQSLTTAKEAIEQLQTENLEQKTQIMEQARVIEEMKREIILSKEQEEAARYAAQKAFNARNEAESQLEAAKTSYQLGNTQDLILIASSTHRFDFRLASTNEEKRWKLMQNETNLVPTYYIDQINETKIHQFTYKQVKDCLKALNRAELVIHLKPFH